MSCRTTVARIVVVAAFLAVQSAVAEQLTQEQADKIRAKYGVGWYATGNCIDRAQKNCTSLEGIHDFVLFEVVVLKQASGCKITISGGTETGHTPGQHSHANGYKADLRLSAKLTPGSTCILDFIQQYAVYEETPKPGWRRWKWGEATYTHEIHHWDIKKTGWGLVDRTNYTPTSGL